MIIVTDFRFFFPDSLSLRRPAETKLSALNSTRISAGTGDDDDDDDEWQPTHVCFDLFSP